MNYYLFLYFYQQIFVFRSPGENNPSVKQALQKKIEQQLIKIQQMQQQLGILSPQVSSLNNDTNNNISTISEVFLLLFYSIYTVEYCKLLTIYKYFFSIY